jgi:hypothetical protein
MMTKRAAIRRVLICFPPSLSYCASPVSPTAARPAAECCLPSLACHLSLVRSASACDLRDHAVWLIEERSIQWPPTQFLLRNVKFCYFCTPGAGGTDPSGELRPPAAGRHSMLDPMRAGRIRRELKSRDGEQREGLHTTTAATTTASTSLSGHFDISVQTTGLNRRVTESSRIASLRAVGLHVMPRSVAEGGGVMFLGNLMLQTLRFA